MYRRATMVCVSPALDRYRVAGPGCRGYRGQHLAVSSCPDGSLLLYAGSGATERYSLAPGSDDRVGFERKRLLHSAALAGGEPPSG